MRSNRKKNAKIDMQITIWEEFILSTGRMIDTFSINKFDEHGIWEKVEKIWRYKFQKKKEKRMAI